MHCIRVIPLNLHKFLNSQKKVKKVLCLEITINLFSLQYSRYKIIASFYDQYVVSNSQNKKSKIFVVLSFFPAIYTQYQTPDRTQGLIHKTDPRGVLSCENSSRHDSTDYVVHEQVRKLFSVRWYLWCECLMDEQSERVCVRNIGWYFHVCECVCVSIGWERAGEMWKLMFLSLRDVTSLQRNKTSAVLVTGYAASANWKLVPPYLEGK